MSKRLEKLIARLLGMSAGIVALLSTVDALEKYEYLIVGAAYFLSQTAGEMGVSVSVPAVMGKLKPARPAACTHQSDEAVRKP